MRLPVVAVLAAAATLLAGCTVPEEGDELDPLFGLCPQWVEGPGSASIGLLVPGNGSEQREVVAPNATFDGRPLDLYRIRIGNLSVDGRLEMRAFAADGRQLGIRDYRIEGTDQIVPVVAFNDGSARGKEFDVFLSPVTHGSEPSPLPLTLRWTSASGESQVDVGVTFHYKVCGS